MPVENDILQFRFWCIQGDQASVNVRYWRVDSHTGNGPSLLQCAQALDVAVHQLYKDTMVSAATYRGVQCQRVHPFPPTAAAFTVANSGVGSSVGDPLPRQVTGLITFTTAMAGRKFRGRTYVPFQAEADNTVAGIPAVGHVTDVGLLGAALRAQYNVGAGADTAVLDAILPTRVPVPNTDPVRYVLNGQFTLITGHIARTIWATQRRRGDFGRKNLSPI